ncbi:hypothetical protein B0H14DRAFT_1104907 [Mycena olivaceomarginata]|nr:hypothetical protein B0H14DRAFT_1104907 [Mycena olivaceomarginata]
MAQRLSLLLLLPASARSSVPITTKMVPEKSTARNVLRGRIDCFWTQFLRTPVSSSLDSSCTPILFVLCHRLSARLL